MNPSITPISTGQKEQVVRVVSDATRKATGTAIDELAEAGVVNSENLQRLLKRGDELVASITTLVKQKLAEFAENIAGCLKLISGAEVLTLESTDGKEIISKAKDDFPGWIDGDFKGYGCDVKSEPTAEVKVQVHEMIKDGDFRMIFGGLSNNLDTLCLTQPQIIQFVKKYRTWLRDGGYATFFLFKVGDEFFVAHVRVFSDGLKVFVYRFSYDYVWNADDRYRVVVPQLALAS